VFLLCEATVCHEKKESNMTDERVAASLRVLVFKRIGIENMHIAHS
jgi:hypothetical protein